jgi:hypothetical protein
LTSTTNGNYWTIQYDSNNNLYFNKRGIIQTYINDIFTTIAGNGTRGFSGDGGQAVDALIGDVRGIAFDSTGNLFFTDYDNNVIRRIDTVSGIITTVAGNGVKGNSGSGGLATSASLSGPQGLIIDLNDNLFFSCFLGNVINKVDSNGILTTIAGNGTGGFSGDGGQATSALITFPSQIALYQNDLYFADGGNYRIRKINLNSGIISTVVGTGISSNTGDGGQATSATISNPRALIFDKNGNMYIGATESLRKVDINGIITTFAGNGISGNSGDGGLPSNASLSYIYTLALDLVGNLIINDINNINIRKINLGEQ